MTDDSDVRRVSGASDPLREAYSLLSLADSAKSWAEKVRSRVSFHAAAMRFAVAASSFAYLADRYQDERRLECADKAEESYREATVLFERAADAVFHEARGPLRGEADA